MKNLALHLWPNVGSCDHNEYSQHICNGFAKLYRFIFESNLDSVGAFDLLLLYSFVIIFLAFLVASAFTIFEEDQKVNTYDHIEGNDILLTHFFSPFLSHYNR